jgi:hypothetical protein
MSVQPEGAAKAEQDAASLRGRYARDARGCGPTSVLLRVTSFGRRPVGVNDRPERLIEREPIGRSTQSQ